MFCFNLLFGDFWMLDFLFLGARESVTFGFGISELLDSGSPKVGFGMFDFGCVLDF